MGLRITTWWTLWRDKRRLAYWRWLLVLSLPAGFTTAQVQIIGYEIPGLHQQDKAGVYDQILQKVVIADGMAILDVYPPARAERTFKNCQNCCITPVNNNPEFYDFVGNVVSTAAINHARIYIFSPPGSEPFHSLSQLNDKVIGTRFGMPYGKTFNSADLKKIEVSDLGEHISLMKLGHIDAFLAYAPDIYDMFKEEGVTPYPHVESQPYALHPDTLVCRSVTREFVDTFNKRIKSLRQSGELQKILGDRYLPPLNN